jgi:glucoamylase
MAHTPPKYAPGKPGISPTWCSSDKDLIITALGSSRTWATLGHGILNEVYWPSTGRPQIRDLGFIVAREEQWWEVKRLNRYQASTPQAYVMLPTIVHHGDGFSLALDVVCNDLSDVVLVKYDLEGEGCKLYTLMAPRLGSQGRNNSLWTSDGAFIASGDGQFACLRSDGPFASQSVGYVGTSDGWTDFNQNGRMTWTYTHADDGNVAAVGELASQTGALALAFGVTAEGVETLTRTTLAEGFECIRERVRGKWEQWGANWDPPKGLKKQWRQQADHSTAVLKTCEDRLFPGAVVASLSIPWGNSRDDLGGYHLVWPRDSAESAFGMISVGDFREARQLAAYLIATQQPDGHWTQNFFPNGRSYWTGVQLDQTSLPIVLVAKLIELNELGELHGIKEMVRRAVQFLVRAGPVTPQDRWEENEGISVFALSLMISALVGATEFLESAAECEYALDYADYLNRRIEDWLYVRNTGLAKKHGTQGHYIRIASPAIFAGTHGEIALANCAQKICAAELVALDYMYLARLGLRSRKDARMSNTLRVVEGELRRETPSGPSFYRYNGDAYGEHADGAPYSGTGGIGRLWPLLTGERGHLAVQLGEDPGPYLDAMCKMTGAFGLIPEQIWDADPIPERGLYPGKPTGSAMPLLWAHAEFVKLATVSATKIPLEMLDLVRKRYDFKRPEPDTWHWRTAAPFCEAPEGCNVLIESTEPFRLHFGFDGWKHCEDCDSELLGLGMHGVRLTHDEHQGREVNFTMFYPEQHRWEQLDYSISFRRRTKQTKEHTLAAQSE